MFSFTRPVKREIAIACAYVIASTLLEIVLLKQVGLLIDKLVPHSGSAPVKGSEAGVVQDGFFKWLISPSGDALGLRNAFVVFVMLGAGMIVLRYLREVANAKFSMRMVFYIRSAVYDKIQRLGFGYHDAHSSGQLINRALSDLQHVRAFVQTAILTTLDILLIVVGNIVLLMTISPAIAGLALVPLPFWVYYILRFGKRVQPAVKAALETEDRSVQLLTENAAGVHVVKAFATEDAEIAKFNANSEEFKRRVLRRIAMFADFQPIIRGIATASQLSLVLLGAYLVFRRKVEPGDLFVFAGAIGIILNRLQQIGTVNEQYQSAIVSSRRLYEVLDAPPTVPEKPDAQDLPKGAGHVVFENVSFGYDPAKPVIKGLSFEIKGGSIVAIVGPTGAGKSTLVSLLARFYDPQQGRVLIDGVDLRDTTLTSLRRAVAFVFQETYLFSDTVAANIAYGRPVTGLGEIEAAARLAQAHDFIEGLPQGYDTVLSERGSSLSGGQRQRLAIARAILFEPRVLVLDDATAAVDPETEDRIRRGTRAVMFERTTFLIAHRISTVKRADVVLVVEGGRITQMGTHEQLMRQPGHYRHIAQVQLRGDDHETRPDDTAKGAESPSHLKRVAHPAVVNAAADHARQSVPAPQQEGV